MTFYFVELFGRFYKKRFTLQLTHFIFRYTSKKEKNIYGGIVYNRPRMKTTQKHIDRRRMKKQAVAHIYLTIAQQ